MQQWLAFPFVRYACGLIAGILLAWTLPIPAANTDFAISVALLLLLAVFAYAFYKHYTGLLPGLSALLIVMVIGYWRTAQQTQQQLPLATPTTQYWWLKALQEPEPTAKSYRFMAEAWPATGEEAVIQVLVYLPKNASTLPSVGERVLAKGQLREVGGPLNPHEFNYRAYLATKGVHYQLFARLAVSSGLDAGDYNWWIKTAYSSRSYLLEQIKEYTPSTEVAAVVSAMVLGQRSELDLSLKQAYSSAGVMHVLAVSGLHVGMVAALFFWIFRYVGRSWGQRLLWLLLVLLVLWSYAWLTGLSPSALRATVMFSMIAIGKTGKRKGNIYNSIALSAFLLLLYDPFLLLQVGFQLSYLAVIGIVYLQPRISKWYQPKQSWKKKLWELLSVTLAAQLATFPLGLYYFHQFPTYFFIGNLLAVPLAGLIMYSTLIFLVVHWLPVVNIAMAWLLSSFTQGLNLWVRITEALPSSKLIAIISAWETLLIYAGLLFLLILFRRRSISWAIACFLCFSAVAVGGFVRTYERRQQEGMLVYQIPGHTLLHFIKGNREVLLPVGETPEEQQLSYHVNPARTHMGFENTLTANAMPKEFAIQQHNQPGFQILVWEGLQIAVVEEPLERPFPANPLSVDLVLLRNSPWVKMQTLQRYFTYKELVADASNSQRYRQQLKSAADSLNLPIYITSEAGAYYLQP